ncbi:MAG: hypothetical protein K2X43_12075 [Hyphomonadaceae bacterium]|jgi:predicted anti-sigma-YlaC factor YlaD|nr:hypothetical protein [Hyphomonadaceae bacterium]
MLNTFSDWLFNVLIWGAIVVGIALGYHTFVAPILDNGVAVLVGLGVVLVVSLFWPKF